ncbi:MAG TPA: HYR domain-containing protein [Pyrinomonadaceae bacterium]|nr:HYR domain-containing protein [Pyrinomonadaceae bacterium]
MRTVNTSPNAMKSVNSILLVGALMIVAAVLAAPVYSVNSGSLQIGSSRAKVSSKPSSNASQLNLLSASDSLARRPSSTLGSLLAVPGPLQETIATFAADCETPKVSFTLGETVCAVTNGVDLNFPGGRWVHWLRPNTTIAHGGSGITDITTNPQSFSFVPDAVGAWKATIAETGDDSQTPAVFTVTGNPPLATYQSNCLLAQDSFTVGDTVCAKADANFSGTRYIYWVDSQGAAVQTDAITSTSPSATRVMTEAGNWSVYLSDGDGLLARAEFSVSDPQDPKVDLSVVKYNKSGDLTTGNPVSYAILVTNNGPDSASTVQLTDAVPTDLAYVSSSQDSGPIFTRTQESPTTTWEIAALAPGATATFTVTYTVNGAAGTNISNTAVITNATEEIHSPDNTSTTFDSVVSGGGSPDCSLDCPNDIVTTATTHGQNGGANVTFAGPEPVGSCGTITNSPASGSFFPIGITTVTSTSATGGGFCSFTVTVVDTAAPTITCPSNISVTANSGQGQAFVPDPNGNSSNVGSPMATGDEPLEVTGSREDGDGLTTAYPIGVTDITWIATDPSGRQATCTQTITVLPNQLLTISCPANKTANSPTGCDPATVNPGTPSSSSQTATILGRRSDNLAYSNTAEFNDPYPIGTTTIEWTANDTDGQSASCTQTVTVTGTDTTPPTLNVPPNVSATTSSCTATLDDELGVATAEDECGTVNITRSGVPTFSCPTPGNPNRQCESFVFPTGTTIITYTATNSSGLSSTGQQTVTVTEDPAVNPTVTAPGDVTLYTGPGATSCGVTVTDLNATLGTATANDNCPGVTVTRDVSNGHVFPLGNTTVTYTATDRSGNTAVDQQVVTVVDNTTPVVTAPAAVTLYTGPGATACGVTVTDLDGTFGTGSATDNCPGVGAVSRSGVPSGNNFPVGTTTLTYSATDANGNTGSATQVVTVVDNTVPVVTAPAAVTLYTGPGATACGVNVANLDATLGTGSATDNCPGVGAVSRSGVPSGNNFPVGTTTLTYSATDAHGNTGSATQVVTVIDNTQPVISCPSNITIESTCPTGAIGTYSTPTATDNCGVQSVDRNAGSLASGSVFPIGTSTVTHTATDVHGNTSSCSFTVTVLTPQAVVQNLIDSVTASSLTGPQKNGLLSKLNAALSAINSGQQNQACAKLSDFVNSVGNLISHGDISAAQGNSWINSANNVRNTIGCTNLPCS